jgi:hypothetical protein
MDKELILTIFCLDSSLLHQEISACQPNSFTGKGQSEILQLVQANVRSRRFQRISNGKGNGAAEEEGRFADTFTRLDGSKVRPLCISKKTDVENLWYIAKAGKLVSPGFCFKL